MKDTNRTENFFPNTKKLAQTHLKCCPLCNALNSVSNDECFVCTWRGAFSQDPKQIEEGLKHLLRKCPEFRERTPKLPSYSPQGPIRTWRFLLRRVLRGSVDFRV